MKKVIETKRINSFVYRGYEVILEINKINGRRTGYNYSIQDPFSRKKLRERGFESQTEAAKAAVQKIRENVCEHEGKLTKLLKREYLKERL